MHWYLLVLEAMLRLITARLTVTSFRFGRWRRRLGSMASGPLAVPAPSMRDRQLARAVERASQRLPFEVKCLPRAMALHAMLRRRRRPSQLVIAALPGCARGTLDDLHAWVEVGGEMLIGAPDRPFYPLVRFDG